MHVQCYLRRMSKRSNTAAISAMPQMASIGTIVLCGIPNFSGHSAKIFDAARGGVSFLPGSSPVHA